MRNFTLLSPIIKAFGRKATPSSKTPIVTQIVTQLPTVDGGVTVEMVKKKKAKRKKGHLAIEKSSVEVSSPKNGRTPEIMDEIVSSKNTCKRFS